MLLDGCFESPIRAVRLCDMQFGYPIRPHCSSDFSSAFRLIFHFGLLASCTVLTNPFPYYAQGPKPTVAAAAIAQRADGVCEWARVCAATGRVRGQRE